jgi:hypothetical protein
MALIAENTRYREVQIERKAVYTFHARSPTAGATAADF